MIEINWIIKDDLSSINLSEYNKICIVCGFFEMRINGQSIGYILDDGFLEGVEDIFDWLYEILAKGIIQLINGGQKYERQLLVYNLTKIVFQKEEMMEISYVSINTDEIYWCEKVYFQQFCDEVIRNIEKFLKEIEVRNSDLLDTTPIKNLVGMKQTIIQQTNCC